MTDGTGVIAEPQQPSFAELFTPKLVTILREGYGLANLRADAFAGLTVAIVALPLSMAIAIASGASPAQGLYTAIIGGFLVSALGGSRFQIGGPTVKDDTAVSSISAGPELSAELHALRGSAGRAADLGQRPPCDPRHRLRACAGGR